jgi:peptidoglycan/xylan/chitin deacetylase (PgdA/CDA1 family)
MYHDVFPSTDARGGGAERFAVPLSSFELMLDLVAEAGLRGSSMADATRADAPRSVAITFDDGTRSQFEQAFPALQRRGMTATFFVTTDWIGQRGFMGWDQLRELTANGMSVQSHTKSHPFLSELDSQRLLVELSESKAALDRHLSQETTELSLPGGDAPRRPLRHLLWEAGYRVVAGSRWGVNHRSDPLGATFIRPANAGWRSSPGAVAVFAGGHPRQRPVGGGSE